MFFAFTALVSAAAASYAGYASMAPQSQLYGRTLTHGPDPRQIALTYDDGPNDPHTLRLLDVLAKHQAKATFFLIGKYVRQRPEIARAIQAAGHEIGNHTYSHPNLIFVSARRLRQELEDCNKALEDVLGLTPLLFRPPFGGRRPNVLRIARSLGMQPVMWSITGYDWNAKSPEFILGKVMPGLNSARAEIVLLHDGGHLAFGVDRAHTVEATRRLLESSPDRRFVPVSGLNPKVLSPKD
ncbi:MAG TPA: polysaccharide deacetylase family protein [Candidatus Sulfotelmatobacter sp.]|nr:polysaccharide deacetylase family protein [Candidatus Sulfotelmatobacter sp.]